mgnify:CR=1 FL=1
MKNEAQTLSQLTERLKEIAEELEQPQTDLDRSIALFDEGVEVSRICLEKLQNYQGKITQISEKLNGIEVAFDGGEA